MERWNESEDDAGNCGDGDGVSQNAQVGRQIERDRRNIRRKLRHHDLIEGLKSPKRENGSKRTTGEGDEEALGQKLADQASPAGSGGESNGDFFLTRGGAREQQIRDVGAGNQKDQSDGKQRDSASSEDDCTSLGFSQKCRGVDGEGRASTGVRLIDASGDHREVGARAGEGDSGLQPSDHFEPTRIGVGQQRCAGHECALHHKRSPETAG